MLVKGDLDLQQWFVGELIVEKSAGSAVVGVSPSGRNIIQPIGPWKREHSGDVGWISREPDRSAGLARLVSMFDLGQDFALDHRRSLARSLGTSACGLLADETRGETTRACLEALESQGVLRCMEVSHDAIHLGGGDGSSTAFDYGTGAYVGLHIDNEWLGGGSFLVERNRMFGLVVVNIGGVERYLHLVDRSAAQLASDVGGDGGWTGTVEQLKDRFLLDNPAYPVLRVRIEPGQGYFCNPQYVIHDGGVNSVGMPDVSLLIFGTYEIIC